MWDLIKSVFTKSVPDTSSGGSLDKVDLAKLAKHAGIVGLSSFLTVLATKLNVVDLGEYSIALIPVISLGINAALKWLKNNDVEV